MQNTTRLKLAELSDHLVCVLCRGYLVDATTIAECLHSFCRSCIVRHLESNKSCPRCDDVIHKTKPLINLRPDRTLQTLVYKLVPGLYQNEMRRRRTYYASTPTAVPMSGEDKGEVEDSHLIYTEDEKISLCLQHCDRLPSISAAPTVAISDKSEESLKKTDKRHLLCPAMLTIGHLKKFLRHKFDLPVCYQVEVFHTRVSLKDVCTLMDVANIYSWKRMEPLRLYYLVYDKTKLSLDLPEPSDKPIITTTVRLPKKKNEVKRKPVNKSTRNPPTKTKNGQNKPKLAKNGPKSPKSPKKGLVKSKRFKPPPTTETGDLANKNGTSNLGQSVPSDTNVNSNPVKPKQLTEHEDEQPLSLLKTKLRPIDGEALEQKCHADPKGDSCVNVEAVGGSVANKSKLSPDVVQNGATSNDSKNKSVSTKQAAGGGGVGGKKVSGAKDSKGRKVQSIKMLASKLVNLNGKLFDTEKKPKRVCVDRSAHDTLAAQSGSLGTGGPGKSQNNANKQNIKSPLKYTKLSTKSRRAQAKTTKSTKTIETVGSGTKPPSNTKVGDEYDFDMDCELTSTCSKVCSTSDKPATDEHGLSTEAVNGTEDITIATDHDVVCTDKPRITDRPYTAENISHCQDEEVIDLSDTPVPSPTPDKAAETLVSDDDVVMTEISVQAIDLVNQPDLVRSNLLATQQSNTCSCGQKSRSVDAADIDLTTEVTTKRKEEGSYKPRTDVVMRAADTSSPQLDVDRSKDDKSQNKEVPLTSSVIVEVSEGDTSHRASPASSVCSMTVGQSDHRASPVSSVCSVTVGQSDVPMEESSRSPSSDCTSTDRDSKSVDRDSKTNSTNKSPVLQTTPRARKHSDTVRDKAKSINSIIKRIEERNHGIQKRVEPSCTPVSCPPQSSAKPDPRPVSSPTPRPVSSPAPRPNSSPAPRSAGTPTPRPVSSPAPRAVTSPHIAMNTYSANIVANSPSPVGSTVSNAFSPALAHARMSPSPTSKQLGHLHAALLGPTRKESQKKPNSKVTKSRAGKRSLSQGQGHSGPDTTPIKRLRQMCNGFGDNSAIARQLHDRIPNSYQTKQNYVDPSMQYIATPPPAKASGKQSTKPNNKESRTMLSPQQVQAQMQHARLHGNDVMGRRSQQQAVNMNATYNQPTRDNYGSPRSTGGHNSGLLSPRGGISQTNGPTPPRGQTAQPAHSNHGNYKSAYGEYSLPNPLANGYDEPLELTTKTSRDRKRAEDHVVPSGSGRGVGRGTFLKIPSLVKP